MEAIFLVIGLVAGAGCAWLLLRGRAGRLENELASERECRISTGQDVVRLQAELDVERRVKTGDEEGRRQLETVMKALSGELRKEAQVDLESRQRAVERLVGPLKESLDRVVLGMQELEKARSASHGALSAEIRGLVEAQARLQSETSSLASAMRTTGVRGRWGEMQLRRVVELAGMVAYCDFVEQQTLNAEGRTLRPDLVVRLPGGRNIVIDAKVPFDAYIQASNATDEEAREALMRDHARAIRGHVARLSAKAYWEPFEPTPGFVVLFLPAEPLFHAALEHDAGLIEDAAQQGVMLVSPASLIALLRSVAEGWRQEKVADNARKVSELGKQLYDRLSVLAGHFVSLRKGLDGAVKAYNDAVGSLERNVLVSARRFPDLGVASAKEIPELDPIQQAIRNPQAPELAAPTAGVSTSGATPASPATPSASAGRAAGGMDDGVLDAA